MNNWDMFATWIGANANNGTLYIGGIIAATGLIEGFKLIFWVGFISYLLLALASYMGYKTGVTSMGLTRASFGVKGSILPSVINVIQFIGWAAVNTYIAATSISLILKQIFNLPANNPTVNRLTLVAGIVVMSILHLISISMGEKSVRWVERIGIILVIILVGWETIIIFREVSLQELINWRPAGKFSLQHGKAVDILAAFNLAWVTAAADFSRFAKTKKGSTLYSFLGALLGLCWFGFIGLSSTIATSVETGKFNPNDADPSTVAVKLGLGALALIVIVLTSTTANAVNLMAAGSALTNMFNKLKLRTALWIVTIVASVMTFIPIFVNSFLETFETFLDGIGMFLGPEIAIFLVDFFLLRNMKYDIEELDKVEGNYWYTNGYNLTAIISWIIGVISYLILSQSDYIQEYVGATFISMGITAFCYYIVAKIQMKNVKIKRPSR